MIIAILIILILVMLYKSLKLYVSLLASSAVLMEKNLEPTAEEQKKAIAFVLIHSKKDFCGLVKGWMKF